MPTATPAIALTRQQQAYEATAAMTLTNGIRAASIFAALFRVTIVKNRRAGSGDSAPVCKNGVEQTFVLTPDGVFATIDVFYDPGCTKKFVASKLNAIYDLANSTVALTGTMTTYDTGGRPVAYGAINGTSKVKGAQSTTVITGTLTGTPAGPQLLTFGLTCNLSQTTHGGSCGFGAINNLAPASIGSLGVTSQIDDFVGSGHGSGTVALTGLSGKPGSLKLTQGSGLSWVVSGGRKVVDLTGTFEENVNDNTYAVDVNLMMKDHLIDADVTQTLDGDGMTGTVFQTSINRAAASYRTTPFGSGTIVYSDKSHGNIVFFIVVS